MRYIYYFFLLLSSFLFFDANTIPQLSSDATTLQLSLTATHKFLEDSPTLTNSLASKNYSQKVPTTAEP